MHPAEAVVASRCIFQYLMQSCPRGALQQGPAAGAGGKDGGRGQAETNMGGARKVARTREQPQPFPAPFLRCDFCFCLVRASSRLQTGQRQTWQKQGRGSHRRLGFAAQASSLRRRACSKVANHTLNCCRHCTSSAMSESSWSLMAKRHEPAPSRAGVAVQPSPPQQCRACTRFRGRCCVLLQVVALEAGVACVCVRVRARVQVHGRHVCFPHRRCERVL